MTDIGRLALEAGETLTTRTQRIMKDPRRRAELFSRVEDRMRQVRNLLGPRATSEALMTEIYLYGVHDGAEMQKQAANPVGDTYPFRGEPA